MAERLLVCRPALADTELLRQWERFVELTGAVADVDFHVVEGNTQTPGQTFAGTGALLNGRLAILASFRHAARRREQPLHRAMLARAGFATTYLRETYFEGAADAQFDRARPFLWVGYGPRTERAAALQLAEIVDCRVFPLLLVDDAFVHLERAFCALGSGHILAHLDAFAPQAQQMIRRHTGDRLIEVEAADARALACAPLEAGDALVMHEASPRLRARLHAVGYRVATTDLGTLLAAGGTPRSLALRLVDGAAPAAVAGEVAV